MSEEVLHIDYLCHTNSLRINITMKNHSVFMRIKIVWVHFWSLRLTFIHFVWWAFKLKKTSKSILHIENGELWHFVFVISCANAWDIFLISTSFSTSAPHSCPRLGWSKFIRPAHDPNTFLSKSVPIITH